MMSKKLVIEKIYCFISKDEDGDEGVCGFKTAVGWMPMVAADRERLNLLTPIAKQIAQATKRPVELVEFSVRRSAEVIEPGDKT